MSSDKFLWSSSDLEFDTPVHKSKLHVIHYASDSDLPQSILSKVPDSVAQTLFRQALNEALAQGKSEMHGFIAGYRALESAGYSRDEHDNWISKSGGPCGIGLPGEDPPDSEDYTVRTPTMRVDQDEVDSYMQYLERLAKSTPTSTNVHVNRPIGEDEEKEDDPGTQFVNPEQDKILGATIQNPYDPRDRNDETTPTPVQARKSLREICKADSITVDIPLFLRLLETAREDVKEDDPLHVITERAIDLMNSEDTLTMEDYRDLVKDIVKNLKSDETKDDPGTEDLDEQNPEDALDPNYAAITNVSKRISGSSNIHLNKEGVALAAKLGVRIADKGCFDILYSSPLNRGKETAHEILEACPHTTYAKPNAAIQPWHLGSFEGSDNSDGISHYVDNPDDQPPGEGNDGSEAETFNESKTRQLTFWKNLYDDFENDPTLKIGVVCHSRGLALLQAWVDDDCPADFDVDAEDIKDPDDIEHASVYRWHKDKIEEVDLDDDEPLKPGIYPILHSLTDDDNDEGNEQLEKGGPGSGPHLDETSTGRMFNERHSPNYDFKSLVHDRLNSGQWTPEELALSIKNHWLGGSDSRFDDVLRDVKSVFSRDFKKGGPGSGLQGGRGNNLDRVTNMGFKPTHIENGHTVYQHTNGSSFHSLGNNKWTSTIPGVGTTKHSNQEDLINHLSQHVKKIDVKYLPPIEVQRAAKSAYDVGCAVIGITDSLSDGTGLTEAGVLEVAKYFAAVESASAPETTVNAWGGVHAGKWAQRVIRKIQRDYPSWVGIDLDGTLAQQLESYDGTKIGEPIKGPFFDKVKQAVADGKNIKILTARVANDPDGKIADAIKAWTLKYLGKELPVTNEKDPGMTEIWDDKAHHPDEVTKQGQGVMVAFQIDPTVANKLKVKDGEDPSDMHVTLVYLGKEVPDDKIKSLTTMLKGFAATYAPIDALLRGPTRFSASTSSDGKDVCVAAVESLTLPKFREDLLNKVESLGIEVKKNFSYHPHVTIKFINPKDDLPIQRIDPIPVTFKSITLYNVGEKTDFPLSGTAIAKSAGYGTVIECVNEGNLIWAHVSCNDGTRVALYFEQPEEDQKEFPIQVGTHIRWDDDKATLDCGTDFPLVGISKATGSKEGSWVTINGQHILIGADGKPLAGNPKVLGQRKVSAKVELARKNAVLTGKHEQDIADRSEIKLSKALGIPRTKNNSAYDLRSEDIGIEVKTITHGNNDKITMGKEALGRKLAEQRAEGLKVFTVVADMRGRTQAKYYVKEGLGSFRVGSMTPVSLSDLKEMVTR